MRNFANEMAKNEVQLAHFRKIVYQFKPICNISLNAIRRHSFDFSKSEMKLSLFRFETNRYIVKLKKKDKNKKGIDCIKDFVEKILNCILDNIDGYEPEKRLRSFVLLHDFLEGILWALEHSLHTVELKKKDKHITAEKLNG